MTFFPYVDCTGLGGQHRSTRRAIYSVLRALRDIGTLSHNHSLKQKEARSESPHTKGHQSLWPRDGDANKTVKVPGVASLQAKVPVRREWGSEFQSLGPTEQNHVQSNRQPFSIKIWHFQRWCVERPQVRDGTWACNSSVRHEGYKLLQALNTRREFFQICISRQTFIMLWGE